MQNITSSGSVTTTHYAETALRMRELAAEVSDPALKKQFIDLAAQYDSLVKRAAARARG